MATRLHLNGGTIVPVTRAHAGASWVAQHKCPDCGLEPMRVRAYDDDPVAPNLTGHVTAIAWCAGRHASVGFLSSPVVPGRLVPMGAGESEAVRCKIY